MRQLPMIGLRNIAGQVSSCGLSLKFLLSSTLSVLLGSYVERWTMNLSSLHFSEASAVPARYIQGGS